jgi:SMI1/KNR4 family protein SUKH-1
MLENMKDCARQLTQEDIGELEKAIGNSLPDSYKAFLLRFNGGLPTPDAFPIEGMAKNPYGIIQEFFGIDCPIESSNLKWIYEVFKTDTPPNLFPIASTPSGDVVCVSLWGDDPGTVVIWNYYDAYRGPTYANVYRVAPNFEEFIQGLFRAPESQR